MRWEKDEIRMKRRMKDGRIKDGEEEEEEERERR